MSVEVNYTYLPEKMKILSITTEEFPFQKFVLALSDQWRIKPEAVLFEELGTVVDTPTINRAVVKILKRYIKRIEDELNAERKTETEESETKED